MNFGNSFLFKHAVHSALGVDDFGRSHLQLSPVSSLNTVVTSILIHLFQTCSSVHSWSSSQELLTCCAESGQSSVLPSVPLDNGWIMDARIMSTQGLFALYS